MFLKFFFFKQMGAQCEIEGGTRRGRDGEEEMEGNSEGAGGMAGQLLHE